MDVGQVEHNIERAACLLKALSNERRLAIACALYRGEKSVRSLGEIVGLGQSALSQHLARLREEGLVTTRRDAQSVYYSLANENVHRVLHTLHDIFCPHAHTDQTKTLADSTAAPEATIHLHKNQKK